MAGIDVSSSSTKRALDHALPLVPFIDFLLCLIAFLLVTAVWSLSARLPADARVPGKSGGEVVPSKQLHVELRHGSFHLVWRQGSTVIETVDVPRRPVTTQDGSVRYPGLARAIAEQWRAGGIHRAATDARQDEAVLHTGNSVEYGEIVGVLDALAGPRRRFTAAGKAVKIPAFRVSFAVD